MNLKIPEKELLRLSLIADEIIIENNLHTYSKSIITKIIDKSKYILDRYELDYVLLRIYRKLNIKKPIKHSQFNFSHYDKVQ